MQFQVILNQSLPFFTSPKSETSISSPFQCTLRMCELLQPPDRKLIVKHLSLAIGWNDLQFSRNIFPYFIFFPRIFTKITKFYDFYLPQRSCEGYVFTRVCHSVYRGVVSQHALQQGVCAIPACIAGGIPACLATWGGCYLSMPCSRGSAPRGGVCSRLLLRMVRILLECILVPGFI